MGDKTEISWTRGDDGTPGATWNPTVGCSRISPGCQMCYAERQAATRLSKVPAYAGLTKDGEWTGEVRLLRERLDQPLKWRRPRRIFVDSMSDLFHEDVPDEYIAEVFAVMARAPQHQFQVLTKRPQRMARWVRRVARCEHGWLTHDGTNPAGAYEGTGVVIGDALGWPLPNVWLGTSIESQQYAFRARHLLETPAAVHFVSAEPLLSALDLTEYLQIPGSVVRAGAPTVPIGRDKFQTFAEGFGPRLGWLIVGGESGPGARPMHPAWVRGLRDQCQAAGVPFHFKQFGEWVGPQFIDTAGMDDTAWDDAGITMWPDGRTAPGFHGTAGDGSQTLWRVGKRRAGRRLDGRIWDEFPS